MAAETGRQALLAFEKAKIGQHFAGCWRFCPTQACRKRKRCTGGPRGTFARLGKPLCALRPAPDLREREAAASISPAPPRGRE